MKNMGQRPYTAFKAHIIYYMALYRKHLMTPLMQTAYYR